MKTMIKESCSKLQGIFDRSEFLFDFYIRSLTPQSRPGGMGNSLAVAVQSIGLLIFLLLFISRPAAAAYYDQNGVKVEKDQYDKVVQMRSADIKKINKDGYGESSSRLEDPVRLRNKRIEQWKALPKKGRSK